MVPESFMHYDYFLVNDYECTLFLRRRLTCCIPCHAALCSLAVWARWPRWDVRVPRRGGAAHSGRARPPCAATGRGHRARPRCAATVRGHRALPAPRPVVSFVNSSSIFTVEIVRCYKSELWLVSLGSWLLFFFLTIPPL